MAHNEGTALEEQSRDAIQDMGSDRFPRVVKNKPVSRYTKREVGLEGENLAACSLERDGYELLERNWRCPWGEADIIALDGSSVVLVEVKTRVDIKAARDVIPELAVNEKKRERYGKIALAYLTEHPGLYAVRFDVIAVVLVSDDHARLRHFVNAFSWED